MLKAGFYEVDISPSVLMSCTSFDGETLETVASPPKLTASVWQTDQLKIGIVGADICVIQRQTWQRALAILRDRFGFDALLCAASHAHSAGPGIRDWVLPLEEVAEISDINPKLRADIYRIHEKDWRERRRPCRTQPIGSTSICSYAGSSMPSCARKSGWKR